jgi:hypothetical protein
MLSERILYGTGEEGFWIPGIISLVYWRYGGFGVPEF